VSETEASEKLPEACRSGSGTTWSSISPIPRRLACGTPLSAGDPARCRRFSSSRGGSEREASAADAPLPRDEWEVRRHRLEGWRADAPTASGDERTDG
jgi:hypothetical protein